MLEREHLPESEAFAAKSALLHIAELDLRSTMVNIVRSNVAEAWLNEGRPGRAAALLPEDTHTAHTFSMWPHRMVAAWIAVDEGTL